MYPTLSFYSVWHQTILLVKVRVLVLNGLIIPVNQYQFWKFDEHNQRSISILIIQFSIFAEDDGIGMADDDFLNVTEDAPPEMVNNILYNTVYSRLYHFLTLPLSNFTIMIYCMYTT